MLKTTKTNYCPKKKLIQTRPLFWGVPEQDWLQVTVRQSKDQRETTKSNNRK